MLYGLRVRRTSNGHFGLGMLAQLNIKVVGLCRPNIPNTHHSDAWMLASLLLGGGYGKALSFLAPAPPHSVIAPSPCNPGLTDLLLELKAHQDHPWTEIWVRAEVFNCGMRVGHDKRLGAKLVTWGAHMHSGILYRQGKNPYYLVWDG